MKFRQRLTANGQRRICQLLEASRQLPDAILQYLSPMNVNARQITCLLFTLFSYCLTKAQYFQQAVDYDIDVTLDTRKHVLRGTWEMTYRNHSPDTLRTIYIHLYPNAYSSKETAFAKQQLRLGLYDFHFSEPNDFGGIDSLNFTIDDAVIPWSLDKVNPDIAILTLIKPLLPGQTLQLQSPMRVRIPKAVSRLGHIGDTYQMTQWYPKPAVYDQDGWHPMPYLNQGEFYSEIGSFDVTMTLPANYLVAATGQLMSSDEIQLLDSLASARNPPLSVSPKSSTQFRTWQYEAKNIHDFAWFADKRFAVRKDTVFINQETVTCWAFFTTIEQELWERATDYIKTSVQFYSDHVGSYPYPQMTAVQVPLGHDFGMEYPMITSINIAGNAKYLDDVISHEVGHNWFYGALASNERKHPWMDEGLNTFYEHLYLREHYESWSEHIILLLPSKPDAMSDEQRMLQYETATHTLIAPDSDPEQTTDRQYFFSAYFKPAIAFDMLRSYMGNEVFTTAIQSYFETWKFRHPQPSDLRLTLEQHCDCDLDWFFDGLLGTDNLIDYRVTDFDNGQLTIENHGTINAPVQILVCKNEDILFQEWHEGFDGTKTFQISVGDANQVEIYDEIISLDLTPKNNVLRIKDGKAASDKLKVRMLGGKFVPGEKYLNLLPVIGWNYTDKAMFGLSITNTSWPPGKLQWGLLPMYSSETKAFTGLGEIQYRHHLESKPLSIEFGLGMKSFHFFQDTHYGFENRYLRIAPRIKLTFGDQRLPLKTTQHLQYRYIYVQQDYGRGIDFDDFVWEELTRNYSVHELKFERLKQRNLGSGKLTATVHAGKGFVRTMVDARKQVIYNSKKKSLYLRAFGGALPYLDNPVANVNLNFNGIPSTGISSRDYLYDELMLARNATEGLASQIVFLRDAQLKTLYNGGISDQWMCSAGIAADLPLPLPIQPYFDLAVFHDPFEEDVALSYSGGLALIFKKDVAEVYLPLFESKDIRNSLTYDERDTFLKRISVVLDLNAFHPFRYKGY